MIRMRVLRFSDLAISTSCCSATERVETGVSGDNATPRVSRIFRASFPDLRPVHREAVHRQVPQEDVLADGQVAGQVELLVDGRMPSAWASCGPRISTGWPSKKIWPSSLL